MISLCVMCASGINRKMFFNFNKIIIVRKLCDVRPYKLLLQNSNCADLSRLLLEYVEEQCVCVGWGGGGDRGYKMQCNLNSKTKKKILKCNFDATGFLPFIVTYKHDNYYRPNVLHDAD